MTVDLQTAAAVGRRLLVPEPLSTELVTLHVWFGVAIPDDSQYTAALVRDTVGQLVAGISANAQVSPPPAPRWKVTTIESPAWTVQSPRFGAAVEISGNGNVAVIGAPSYSEFANRAGEVYVYRRTGASTWVYASQLPRTPVADTQFGYGVDISYDGTMILVSADGDYSSIPWAA